jgi:hypothetical protein
MGNGELGIGNKKFNPITYNLSQISQIYRRPGEWNSHAKQPKPTPSGLKSYLLPFSIFFLPSTFFRLPTSLGLLPSSFYPLHPWSESAAELPSPIKKGASQKPAPPKNMLLLFISLTAPEP